MMDGFDLIVAIEVARKKIMLSGADISFDEINSISTILKKSADRIEELEARVKELEGNIIATDKEYPAYGCHVDLFETIDMKPDECVIDLGRPQDCVYARLISDKTACEYWKPCPRPVKK